MFRRGEDQEIRKANATPESGRLRVLHEEDGRNP